MTNCEKYFGTPMKAALTLSQIGYCCIAFVKTRESDICGRCPLVHVNCWDAENTREWLQEEVVDD